MPIIGPCFRSNSMPSFKIFDYMISIQTKFLLILSLMVLKAATPLVFNKYISFPSPIFPLLSLNNIKFVNYFDL